MLFSFYSLDLSLEGLSKCELCQKIGKNDQNNNVINTNPAVYFLRYKYELKAKILNLN